jgi:hypothetical protein
MVKKISYLLVLIFLVTSCGDTLDSVKRGLTGEKRNSTDEFLVKKKDPLILPPDFEKLPEPGNLSPSEEDSAIQEKLQKVSIEEDGTTSTSTSSSTENSILKQIRKK